jgi:hypothetical protein
MMPVAHRLAFICRDQRAELNQTDQRDFLRCGTSIESLPMSALGQKQAPRNCQGDRRLGGREREVRSADTDMSQRPADVRFAPESGHDSAVAFGPFVFCDVN